MKGEKKLDYYYLMDPTDSEKWEKTGDNSSENLKSNFPFSNSL